jgi:hypothetical protein
VAKFLREPPGGPVGVRSTERSEPRKVATRSEAKGHALIVMSLHTDSQDNYL